ncbi:MAG: hypothetical protein F6J98_27105 [Moorea sp. SIO4G2]|nr:hypothetical protein [Moorena sp. SIO4G2]
MPVLFLSVFLTPLLPSSGFFPLTLPKPPTLPTPDSRFPISQLPITNGFFESWTFRQTHQIISNSWILFKIQIYQYLGIS